MMRLSPWFVSCLLALSAAAETPALRLSYAGKTREIGAAELAALPHQTISTFDFHDQKTHEYSGVPVRAVLDLIGAPGGEKLRGKALRLVVVAHARDGYEVAYALAEFDPAFSSRTVLLADRQDGQPLFASSGPLRLVAPGDKRPARWARMITSLEVIGAGDETASAAGPAAYLLVANKGDRTLSILDPGTGSTVGQVAEEGETGHEVAASPDGRLAFVPIYGNSGVGLPGTDGSIIRVIDLKARRLAGTIDFGKGVRPHCAKFGPKDGLLYVTTELERAVTVIDPVSLRIVGSIPTGMTQSHMLAISSDGRRGYTANVGSGTVSVLDLQARKLITTIAVPGPTQRIAVSPDGRWVFTADQRHPRLTVIDTATNQVKASIALPGIAYGTACTPDGRWLVAALPGSNQAGLIDLTTMTLARTLDLPKSPQEVLVRPDGAIAYISCGASREVAAVDLQAWRVEKLMAAGRNADGLAWARRD